MTEGARVEENMCTNLTERLAVLFSPSENPADTFKVKDSWREVVVDVRYRRQSLDAYLEAISLPDNMFLIIPLPIAHL